VRIGDSARVGDAVVGEQIDRSGTLAADSDSLAIGPRDRTSVT
jgi:hypothetical protein